MDWDDALRHLPQGFMVTDRKGRVLLQSRDIAGIAVGHSFLKLAHADEVVIVGRAAKKCLGEGVPARLARVTGVDGAVHGLDLYPFGSPTPDHLVIVVGPAGEPAFRPTPSPADRVTSRTRTPDTAPEAAAPPRNRISLPPHEADTAVTAAPAATPAPTARRADKTTPAPAPMAPSRATPAPAAPRARAAAKAPAAPAPQPVPEASELVVVAAGGTLPLARALEKVLAPHVRTRAVAVASFVELLAKRSGGETAPAAIETAIDPTTRLWFLGDSPFSDATRVDAWKSETTATGGWALAGQKVRRAGTWVGEITGARATDVVADLQFEIMEIMRRAMPIRRQGRVVDVPPGLKRAAAFLEQPAAMDVQGDNLTQARHHVLVVAIARFLDEGLDPLLATDA